MVFKNILEREREAYESLGWSVVGGKLFALDEVSLLVEWCGEGEPVLPAKESD